jgi:uncharacterized membrane protein YqjE
VLPLLFMLVVSRVLAAMAVLSLLVLVSVLYTTQHSHLYRYIQIKATEVEMESHTANHKLHSMRNDGEET